MPDVSVFCPACGRSTTRDVPAVRNVRDRILGAAAYVALIPAAVFLLVPPLRESVHLRFQSWQSILFTVSSAILGLLFRLLFAIFSVFPVFGLLIAWLITGVGSLGLFTVWLVLVVKAAQGDGFELPLIGPLAAGLAGKRSA
jgi:uncharacterized membrane protein